MINTLFYKTLDKLLKFAILNKMSGCSLIGRVLAYPVLDDAGSNPVTRSKKN